MSSRRGRRQRGRARGWDPAAARAQHRRPEAKGVVPYEEPEDAEDDLVKARYWQGRFEALVARQQPTDPAATQQGLAQILGGGSLTNRHSLRSHGVGRRGAIWSRRRRAYRPPTNDAGPRQSEGK